MPSCSQQEGEVCISVSKPIIQEEDVSKPSVESLENLFLLFVKSLKARQDWLDKGNIVKNAPILEITVVSEGVEN